MQAAPRINPESLEVIRTHGTDPYATSHKEIKSIIDLVVPNMNHSQLVMDILGMTVMLEVFVPTATGGKC